jgi:hypothetical protein
MKKLWVKIIMHILSNWVNNKKTHIQRVMVNAHVGQENEIS